jgi:HJR/Mrr/RecB family endonuclease
MRALFFIDFGGFDDFTKVLTDFGFSVDKETNPRKATKLAKNTHYDLVLAEFHYNPEFRDRVSNTESILATLQHKSPNAKIILLYDTIFADKLAQLKKRYKIDKVLSFPVSENQIQIVLEEIL